MRSKTIGEGCGITRGGLAATKMVNLVTVQCTKRSGWMVLKKLASYLTILGMSILEENYRRIFHGKWFLTTCRVIKWTKWSITRVILKFFFYKIKQHFRSLGKRRFEKVGDVQSCCTLGCLQRWNRWLYCHCWKSCRKEGVATTNFWFRLCCIWALFCSFHSRISRSWHFSWKSYALSWFQECKRVCGTKSSFGKSDRRHFFEVNLWSNTFFD